MFSVADYDPLSGITGYGTWSSLVITYYFHDEGYLIKTPDDPDEDADDDDPGIAPEYLSVAWTAYEQAQFRVALELFSAFTPLQFVEVDSAEQSLLQLALADFGEEAFGTLGFFMPPGEELEGLGVFNYTGFSWERDYQLGSLEQGGFAFGTIIHELGHGLGLAHPHDDGGGSTIFPGVEDSADLGLYDLNQQVYTMMSYNDGWETAPMGVSPELFYGWAGTPMAFDVAALQLHYGINPDHNSDDTVYVLPDSNELGTFYQTIWDTGGTDTILYEGERDAVIDLRAATLRYEEGGAGWMSYVDGIHGGFTIAHGVIIENAIGGSGNDILVGNSADNWLDGGDGLDTAIISTTRDTTTILVGDGAIELDGPEGNDILVNIERIQFDDGTLAFDIQGDAGQVFRLYQAAFGREADADGLGYWIREMDAGAGDISWVANNFLLAQEFIELYGPIDQMNNADYLELLYLNTLDRSGEADGMQYWESQMDHGLSHAAALASFAESHENQERTWDQVADGIWYV